MKSENLLIDRIKDSRKKVRDILENIDYYNENCIYPDDLAKLEQLLRFIEEVEKYRSKKYTAMEKCINKFIYKELESYSAIELEGLYDVANLKDNVSKLHNRLENHEFSEEEIFKISEVLIFKEGE